MSGHRHNPSAATQNQGNSLGDRACVRQSKLYRVHESGNNVKSLLGTSHLCWDQNQAQGAYQGHSVYDHTQEDPLRVQQSHALAQETSKFGRTRPRESNNGSGNFYSGYADEGSAPDFRRGPIAGKPEPRRQSGGSSAYETTASGYGRESAEHLGKYGDSYGDSYGGGRDGGDYGRRASYDREPAYDSRTRARGGAGGGYQNDENANSMRNALSHYGAGGSGGTESSSYGGGGGGGQYRDRDDRGYRSLRDQVDSSANSYRRAKPEPAAEEGQRMAIRTYKGQDRDTRPW